MRLKKDPSEVTEDKLRKGRFEHLAPRAVEAFLGESPKHLYDQGMQPEWVKKARQWAYEAQLPEFIYPVHGWSLYGTPKSPITWFTCKVCGHSAIGSPYEVPRDSFMCAFFGEEHESDWEVSDGTDALRSTAKALDGKPDLIGRFQTKT